MRTMLDRLVRLLRGQQPVLSEPGFGRWFVVCDKCGRVVPMWRCVARNVKPGDKVGCKCGGGTVKPKHISEWRAAYWLLVRGWLIRRVIQRRRERDEWEPRMAVRTRRSARV